MIVICIGLSKNIFIAIGDVMDTNVNPILNKKKKN